MTRPSTVILLVLLEGIASPGAGAQIAPKINQYVQQYAETRNFSGVVRVERTGQVVFEKAYGVADRERNVPNTPKTRFHIASVSMQFTAAAMLRLVDVGALSLDAHVSALADGIEGAEKITIRDLLTERSGLPDINALSDYNEILQQHQTPPTLVAKIAGKPLLFEPGSKYLHEEHSAYNLLALIVEKKTGLPFASAVEDLVLRPLRLTSSVVDDDSGYRAATMAKGYQPEGTDDLTAAPEIHWSAKTGNASVYTTASDEARLAASFFGGDLFSRNSRDAVLDPNTQVGYGWFKSKNERFGQMIWYMNGRAPGFSSFVMYLPASKTTVVVLSNIYSSATTAMGYDIAAISLGLPHESPQLGIYRPVAAELKSCEGTFQYGLDFYQANGKLTLIAKDSGLFLRWPSGDVSALIPVARDEYVDRSYWVPVEIERDGLGRVTALIYDHFRGTVPPPG